MASRTSECVDRTRLVQYLQEQLNEHGESEIREHLDECSACQQQLEAIVAPDTAWEFARDHLVQELNANTEHKSTVDSDWEELKGRLGPTDNPDMLGRLGCYEVCGVVGQGSTATVLKAYEPRLNRFVAIKVLSPTIASKGTARSRFEREAKSFAAVADQNVVPIYSVDEYQGLPFIVMKYVVGGSLQQRIDTRGQLPTIDVARLGMQIAKGLQAAHEIGIVHRDVKPPNVLLEGSGERALVGDFGLARVADEVAITRSGTIAGTPQFMSPEQARGEAVDARSDLFSLGSVMYAACTGRSPFEADTTFGVLRKVSDTAPRPIHEFNSEISDWLVAFIERLHDRNREDRIQSAEEAADILGREIAHMTDPLNVSQPPRQWLRTKRSQVRAWTALVVALMFVGVVVAGFAMGSKKGDGDNYSATRLDKDSNEPNAAIAKHMPAIAIDGNLSDWPKSKRYPISVPYITSRQTTDSEFTGEFRVGFDGEKQLLFVAVETSDDAVRLEPVCDDDDWSVRDACELYLSPLARKVVAPVQFTFRDKPSVAIADREIRELGKAVKAARQATKKGLIYEWQVDLERLNDYFQKTEVAKSYHFDVVCVDRDSRSRIAVFSWTPSDSGLEAAKHMRTDDLGTLILDETR